jgi:hypothetical protein
MPTVTRTHYDVLGVPVDVPTDSLRSAYKKAARRSHPDVGGSAEEFVAVTEAYEVLSNPLKRREYDDELTTPQRPQEPVIPTHVPYTEPVRPTTAYRAPSVDNSFLSGTSFYLRTQVLLGFALGLQQLWLRRLLSPPWPPLPRVPFVLWWFCAGILIYPFVAALSLVILAVPLPLNAALTPSSSAPFVKPRLLTLAVLSASAFMFILAIGSFLPFPHVLPQFALVPVAYYVILTLTWWWRDDERVSPIHLGVSLLTLMACLVFASVPSPLLGVVVMLSVVAHIAARLLRRS